MGVQNIGVALFSVFDEFFKKKQKCAIKGTSVHEINN